MRANRSDVRIALALLCLLTCLYWLTDSAHTSIADEETAYSVTEGLVERGTFVQQEDAQAGDAPRVVVRGRDGNLYAVTGPLQSLLALPLYLVGKWVASAFPTPFYGYFTRFFVCLFNGPVAAATAALLFVFSVDLGYRRRTALFVALAFGVATVTWPYARTFYAETLHTFWLVLAAWAVYRYAHTDRWGWIALAGTAVGLGTATKYVMIVAGPALALYLALELWRRPGKLVRWQWARRTALAGGLPLMLIMSALATFNYVRFGSLLETGYTTAEARGAVTAWGSNATFALISLYGFFFSSGKGFFFFSPPAALALWGLGALACRRRNETWLLIAIAAAYPLFYSLLSYQGAPVWHGGGNWGPRYIVCITPFVMLFVGAFLERREVPRWLRVGSATVLFALGFWVQVSTVLVNYSTYLFSDVPAERQLFQPGDSPLLAQWRLWPRQIAAWLHYDHALRASGESFYVIDGGFYNVEVPDMAPFGRWMEETGRLRIYARPQQALTIQVTYSRPRLADPAGDWSGLHFAYDGMPVTGERQLVAQDERESQWTETVTIVASDVHIFPGTIEITATTWIPLELGDQRALSVFISRVDVLSDGTALAARLANLPRPLPVSTAHPWSWEAMFWFYDPLNAHPCDLWLCYVWTSGLPLSQARTLIIMFSLAFGIGFIASGLWFILTIRKSLL